MNEARQSRWRWDALCLVIVAVAGLLIGSRYVAAFQQTERADFGQTEFSAAVMMACGRGFAVPVVSNAPLDDFLAGRTDAFSCDQLTPEMQPGVLNFTQRLYRYLMTAVVWQWKWSGIAWSRLTPLFGLLFATTLCAAYGLFRLAGGPPVALLAVVPLAVSAHHLAFLPQLRDYAKAPFFLLLILITAHLAMPPLGRRRALLLSAAFGLVLGIGFGFRNDLLITIPPFVAFVALMLPGRVRDNLAVKVGCISVAGALFVASAWPILSGYREGSNTGHVAVLGFTSTFDAPLGVTRPIYSLGPHYLDGYAAALINEYSLLHSGEFVDFTSPAYDAVAVRLVADMAAAFPADVLIRGLAGTLRVLEFPFTINRLTPAVPRGLRAPWVLEFYRWQQGWLRVFEDVAPWAAVLAILAVGAMSWRAGIAAGLLLVYYAAYPSVQFSTRHYFHLEFIAWGALLFVLVQTFRVRFRVRSIPRPAVTNAAITAVALLAGIGGPLAVLRVYQQRTVASRVERLAAAPRTPVSVEEVWKDHRAGDPFDVRYLVLEFSGDRCAAGNVPVTVRYEAKTEANDFTYVANVAVSRAGPTFRLVPVFYNGGWSHFTDFELPGAAAGCLKSVSRIDDRSEMPIYFDVELEPGWQHTNLFQQIARW